MAMDCRFKPLEKWPKKPTPKDSRRNRFRAKWADTLNLLEYELFKLGARDITIEAFFRSHEIRNDGWPRNDARPAQPGVILRFITKKGELEFACDKFADWQQNLRAIGLGLEKLRLIDDYGIVVEEEQQYQGWFKALPTASVGDEAKQLALILCQFAAVDQRHVQRVLTERDYFEQTAAEALRRTHSDTGTGNTSEFQRVLDARNRLRKLKGW